MDGTTIDLGGKQWGMRMTEDGPIELSRATTSDDGRVRVAQRMDSIAHEVVQRKAELEALKAQKVELDLAMEKVKLNSRVGELNLCVALPPNVHTNFVHFVLAGAERGSRGDGS